MVSIKGLDKAEVLLALVNGTRVLGMGRFQDPGRPLTVDDMREVLGLGDDNERMFPELGRRREPLYVDYVFGRPIKVDLGGDEFSEALYDRDAGQGAAELAIAGLRAKVG